MEELFNKKVVLFTGKGGVGRTTVTAACAVAAALRGKSVLVAEVEEPTRQGYSPLARLFGKRLLRTKATRLREGVDGALLTTEKGTELFLTSVLKLRPMARLAMRSKALLALLHAAPSFHEMGIFYHLLTFLEARTRDGREKYDLIFIDMPSTGHTLAFTSLPGILLRLVPKGPMARAMRAGQSFMNDPAKGAACVVTLPETLPVTEALELCEGLEQSNVKVAGLIANRLPIDPFTTAEWERLEQLTRGRALFGLGELDRIQQARSSLARLQAGTSLPLWCVGEFPEQGEELVEAIARAFEEEGS